MRAEGVLTIGLDDRSLSVVQGAAGAAGLTVRATRSLSEGLSALGEGEWLVAILALDSAGSDMELAAKLTRESRVAALVLVTGEPSLQVAMDATRIGALDVLTAPIEREDADRLFVTLSSGVGRVAVPEVSVDESTLVGRSPQLLKVFKEIGRVATSPATVLVTGESGTGKELVARAIHAASQRSSRPFVAINCAAIPEDLLESELLGHERGAFTGAVARKLGRFERADGGTLFLDEIGDMSLVLQAKILRVLQEREIERLGGDQAIKVDVRIIAATHRDLSALIATGEFREDLFYRLAVVRLHLPALRERGDDVRALALHYLARYAAAYQRPLRFISRGALARLEAHAWPGNVRELGNVLERAVLVGSGDTLQESEISLDPPRSSRATGESLPGYSPRLSIAEVEKLHISRVLESVDGHVGRAAEILGMHRNTVSRKAQEYGILPGR